MGLWVWTLTLFQGLNQLRRKGRVKALQGVESAASGHCYFKTLQDLGMNGWLKMEPEQGEALLILTPWYTIRMAEVPGGSNASFGK